jgi:hypothetical protein
MQWSDPLVIIFALVAIALVAICAIAILPQTPAFRQLIVGVEADPQLVGLARALIFYSVPIGLAAATAYLGHWTDPRLVPLVPVALGAIRIVESQFDSWQKPDQNRVDPPPVAGGGDADLAGGAA